MGGETKGRTFEQRRAAAMERDRVEKERQRNIAFVKEAALTPEDRVERARAQRKAAFFLPILYARHG